MFRSSASRVIALVQNQLTFGQRPVFALVRKAMRVYYITSSTCHFSVSKGGVNAFPLPTSFGVLDGMEIKVAINAAIPSAGRHPDHDLCAIGTRSATKGHVIFS